MRILPQISIQLQHARIEYDADIGTLYQSQRSAEVRVTTDRGAVRSPMTTGRLRIDSTDARDALGAGPVSRLIQRSADNAERIVLDTIARIASIGDRYAQIDQPNEELIADIAREAMHYRDPYSYIGMPGIDLVRVAYEAVPVSIEVRPASVQFDVQPHVVQQQYVRGKWEFGMVQYPDVIITPPRLDARA